MLQAKLDGVLPARLRELADGGIAVVAACREVDPRVPDRIVTLEANR